MKTTVQGFARRVAVLAACCAAMTGCGGGDHDDTACFPSQAFATPGQEQPDAGVAGTCPPRTTAPRELMQ